MPKMKKDLVLLPPIMEETDLVLPEIPNKQTLLMPLPVVTPPDVVKNSKQMLKENVSVNLDTTETLIQEIVSKNPKLMYVWPVIFRNKTMMDLTTVVILMDVVLPMPQEILIVEDIVTVFGEDTLMPAILSDLVFNLLILETIRLVMLELHYKIMETLITVVIVSDVVMKTELWKKEPNVTVEPDITLTKLKINVLKPENPLKFV